MRRCIEMWVTMDIGTNSCRLLIAEYDEVSGDVKVFERAIGITRIGEGMNNHNKVISGNSMERTLSALEAFSRIIGKYSVDRLRIVGTQAVREADNKEELVKEIKTRLGWELEIIPGDYEARLSYQGAVRGIKEEGVPVVIDIGGGSTEFIYAKNKREVQAISLPLGALRLLENTQSDKEILEKLDNGLKKFEIPEGAFLVAVGGTATTLGAVKLELGNYDAEKVQGLKISISEIMDTYKSLDSRTDAERLEIPGISPGREDIIIPGLRILINIMTLFNMKVMTISDHDLLFGLIYDSYI
jgi:exopolyphosphatase/guanosine-5'-triphosphate,3'-diphosphate pyrophosphatase